MGGGGFKTAVSRCFKEPTSIADKRLAWEVEQCVQYDDNYSPLVDKIRHAIGLEYEYVLQEKVRNLDLDFKDEDDLRREGYAKTPDIMLNLPVAVDGHVVKWIESKASFGDDYSHTQNLPQFWGYQNRYGPGLVIYWFGFVDDLDADRAKGILVSDRFPENVVRMSLA